MPADMKNSAAGAGDGAARVEIVGDVAGVDACRVLSDRGRIVVGSALDCDVVLRDPLVPARAFELRFDPTRIGPRRRLASGWLLEPSPGARVFVNNDLAKTESLVTGDEIAVGCHRLRFKAASSGVVDARAQATHMAVDDVIARVTAHPDAPQGFFAGLPSWRDKLRTRRAALVGVILGAILLLPFLLPREEYYEQVQPPMEVVISNLQMAPASETLRSLSDVQRKSFEAPQEQTTELQPMSTPATPEMQAKTIDAKPLEIKPPPAPIERVAADAGPQLAPLAVAPPQGERLELKQESATLGRSAPVRRLSVDETARPQGTPELATPGVKTDNPMKAPAASTKLAQELAQSRSAPAPQIAAARTNAVQELAAFKPSPLKFEELNGNRVPVVRMSEALTEIALPQGAQGIVLDGKITESEVNLSWKSGRFRLHGPGTPPEADPATYCYVGKMDVNGRKHLYISFLCADPNTDQIIANWAQNTTNHQDASGIILDDTVEIFLDVNFDRKDYHQLIVNAKGFYWAAYYPTPTGMLENRFQGWNVSPTVKTTINKAAGNWVCEIAIPFDQLGGEPAKGARWSVNFCRNFRGQKSDHQLQTWFLVYDQKRNYHHPDLFGVFQW